MVVGLPVIVNCKYVNVDFFRGIVPVGSIRIFQQITRLSEVTA